jgi:signal recognition particle receptor subunit beta
MRSLKVVVTGPQGSGKTAFIRSVSEIAVLSTERQLTESDAPGGESTVVMDFGRVTVADEIVLYLFGTPAHEGSSAVWETLGDGLLGFVVLVDMTDRASVAEGARAVAMLGASPEAPFVVGLSRVEPRDRGREEEGRRALAVPSHVPVLGLDARERGDVRDILVALMGQVIRAIG